MAGCISGDILPGRAALEDWSWWDLQPGLRPVAATDVRGTITYVNEKFCAIGGYSKDELIGQDHRILNSSYHAKEFFQEMYQAIANGQVWHGEIKNRAKDGSM